MEGLPWGLMDSENGVNGFGGLLRCLFYLRYFVVMTKISDTRPCKGRFFFPSNIFERKKTDRTN